MLDENTWHLNNYEHHQSTLEQQWENTMQEKQEAVVELAISLIKQEVATEVFDWVFSAAIDDAHGTKAVFKDDLRLMLEGEDTDWFGEDYIIETALEGACRSLYDCELDEITPHGTRGMIKQVLEGLK